MQLVGEENIPRCVEELVYCTRKLTTCRCISLLENPSIVLALLSEAAQRIPYPACCSRLLNESLCHFYTQRAQPMGSSLTLLGLVRKAFLATPASSMSPLLKATEQGLRLWLIDEHSLLSDDQYNQHTIPIYCLALESLQRLPPTVGTIIDFGDFLTSAFVRVPSPALGPKAFRAYWQATFHGRHEFVAVYPDSLKQCLKAFDEATGGDLGMGLSLETASDMTPTVSIVYWTPARSGWLTLDAKPRSVVSSSQSPFGRAVEMLYDARRFSQPRFTNTAVSPNKPEPKMLLSPGSDQIFMEPTNRPSTSHLYITQAVPDLRQFESAGQSGRQASLHSVTAGNPLKASTSGTWLRTKRHGTPIGMSQALFIMRGSF